jgi:LmbE family N-acetylglucosaminyl deacetylase
MSKSVLVVAAHPDDETLGMGGTIARHCAEGDRVQVLFLANGVGSRGADTASVQRRQVAATEACGLLGATVAGFLDFPDNAFDSVPLLTIIQAIEQVKRRLEPSLVYTHHGGDLNIDHRLACQAVLTAFRPQPGEVCGEIYSFEVNSATEWSHPSLGAAFAPDTYVEVSAFRAQLLDAYRCYREELLPDPHARSPRALEIALERRGREVGLEAAEAFMTLRRIIR